MKKKFLLILTVSMGLMLSACSQEATQATEGTTEIEKSETSDETTLQLNEPASYENWEFTLTNVEFADELYTNPHEHKNDYKYSPDDKFMLPLANNETNRGTQEIEADGEHILLTYTFTYKYTGKTVQKDLHTTGAPYVYFGNDYIFSGMAQDDIAPSEYMAVIMLQEPPAWNLLSYAGMDSTITYNFNIRTQNTDYEYEPLDGTIHEVRGYIKVPREIYENTNESLSICFQLPNQVTDKYIIR